MLRTLDPLGSIDRNEPSVPTPMARGAPKFDPLPTRIRFGSSTAPGLMNEANEVGIGLGNATVALHMTRGGVLRRNVPTCEMADAPGIFVAMTRAWTCTIACARAACHAPAPSNAVTPAAKAKMLRTVRLFCSMKLSRRALDDPVSISCTLRIQSLRFSFHVFNVLASFVWRRAGEKRCVRAG